MTNNLTTRRVLIALALAAILFGVVSVFTQAAVHAEVRPVDPPQHAEHVKQADRKDVTGVLSGEMNHGNRGYLVVFKDNSVKWFSPCDFEDSRNCFWDAGVMGNQQGRSLVNLRGVQHFVPRWAWDI